MTDQNTFMETVNSVAEIMQTSAEPLSEKEVFSYFEDMELEENQKRLVMEYLLSSVTAEEHTDFGTEDTDSEEKGENREKENSTESKVFQMYLEEIAMLPQYTEQEKEALYGKLIQGEKKVIETLLAVWLEQVLMIAKKYFEPKLNAEDLVQEGNIALFLKLQELCGSHLAEDVERILEAAVEEGIMTYASEMSGERDMEHTILGKVSLMHEAKTILAEEKGQTPTINELSEYTKLSVKELEDIEDLTKDNSGN